MAQRHEIPTHLNVEDRAFYGLSARQFMYLTIGLAGAYSLWNQWPELLLPARVAIATVLMALAAALALIRPHGRGLDDWVFVVLHYVATPKGTIWRVQELCAGNLRSSDAAWAQWAPRVNWAPEPSHHQPGVAR